MYNTEKITEDYKKSLQEKEQRMKELFNNDSESLIYQKDVDEIQIDFNEDERTKEYHGLRKRAKYDEQLQQDLINAQRKIFYE
jgi:hypothetical protein